MSKKNVLVTGGYGYFGTNFIKQIIDSKKFNVFCLSDRISSLKLETFKPDVIVHIAYKNIGYKGKIIEDNLKDLECLSNLNINNDIHLLFISSDYVFKEQNLKEYKQEDLCCPNTDYGISKVMCEDYIKNNFLKSTILRTSMLYGYYNKNRDNFIRFAFDNFTKNQEFETYEDVFCRPTHVKDLSNFVLECIEKEMCGTFHASSDQLVNRCEIAKQICLQNNFNINLIKPIKRKENSVIPASLNLVPSKEFLKISKYSIYSNLKMLGEKND